MKQEDLIKKLEELKTPNIEIQSHQQELKRALLNSGYFKEKPSMLWTKKIVPATIALVLIVVLGLTVVNPRLQQAKAAEIAKNDPRIKELIQEYGIEIQEVKLQDGKAYVLLTFPEERLLTDKLAPTYGVVSSQAGETIFFTGSVAEVDLKQKKVAKIELLTEKSISLSPLTQAEQSRAIEILQTEPAIQQLVPDIWYYGQTKEIPDSKEIKTSIKLMPPYRYRLETEKATGQIKAVPDIQITEDKRVNVVVSSDGQQQIITVNLTQDKVEGSVLSIEKTITFPIERLAEPGPTDQLKVTPGFEGAGGIESGGQEVKVVPFVPMPSFETEPTDSGQTEGYIESETGQTAPAVQP